jgi:hypothetical protein
MASSTIMDCYSKVSRAKKGKIMDCYSEASRAKKGKMFVVKNDNVVVASHGTSIKTQR